MKKLLVFHSPLSEAAPPDELDVLDEVAFFKGGLVALGYDVVVMPFPYDMMALQSTLEAHQPAMVVNLVETLFSNGRLAHIAPFLLDHFAVPYTGCPAEAIFHTNHKVLAKKTLQEAGILTPAFFTYEGLQQFRGIIPGFFLVKSVWEHASFGLDESNKLLFDQKDELIDQMHVKGNGAEFFAEKYIDGREFNISLLDSRTGPIVLPPAEICFHYPDDKPRIVGYRAKWDETSFEFANTARSFSFEPEDKPLLDKLRRISLDCWSVFGLKGYARVDFRVDHQENIFVLEVNANPCISQDSGFVAAAHHAGITQKQLIANLVAAIA